MDHEQRILKKIMTVQSLRPHEQQVAKQITRDTYNMSYIIWAFTLLAITGAFMYVIGRNSAKLEEVNNTLDDVKANQRTMLVYFNKINEDKKDE
jgi:TPP-dependent indolepyruvate ferredoxin oxidoreductase alpha subunit